MNVIFMDPDVRTLFPLQVVFFLPPYRKQHHYSIVTEDLDLALRIIQR